MHSSPSRKNRNQSPYNGRLSCWRTNGVVKRSKHSKGFCTAVWGKVSTHHGAAESHCSRLSEDRVLQGTDWLLIFCYLQVICGCKMVSFITSRYKTSLFSKTLDLDWRHTIPERHNGMGWDGIRPTLEYLSFKQYIVICVYRIQFIYIYSVWFSPSKAANGTDKLCFYTPVCLNWVAVSVVKYVFYLNKQNIKLQDIGLHQMYF